MVLTETQKREMSTKKDSIYQWKRFFWVGGVRFRSNMKMSIFFRKKLDKTFLCLVSTVFNVKYFENAFMC